MSLIPIKIIGYQLILNSESNFNITRVYVIITISCKREIF